MSFTRFWKIEINFDKVTKRKWYDGTTDGPNMTKMGVLPLKNLCGTLNAEILIELKFIHFRILEMSTDWANVLFYKMKFLSSRYQGQWKFSYLDKIYLRWSKKMRKLQIRENINRSSIYKGFPNQWISCTSCCFFPFVQNFPLNYVLTVASISNTRVTKGSNLRIVTTRWGRFDPAEGQKSP